MADTDSNAASMHSESTERAGYLSEPAAIRYSAVAESKSGGVTYTPKILADFVAKQVVNAAGDISKNDQLRILDPAIGDGELIVSLLDQLVGATDSKITVHGFETDPVALARAEQRITKQFPGVSLYLRVDNFLEVALGHVEDGGQGNLFETNPPPTYDLVIANPPYVRTQIMGATQSQALARRFNLTGRVDLYYAFILGISYVLRPSGVAGVIVSNRFMSTKSGASVRRQLLERFRIHHAWDLGDTKLFDAAVLPAVLVVERRNGQSNHQEPAGAFTSIYQTDELSSEHVGHPIDALSVDGTAKVPDGRRFEVRHGQLDTSGTPDGIWRMTTPGIQRWMNAVDERTWGTFGDIGKVRVGVKTCADGVFIRDDWDSFPEAERPELLRPLITHHVARCFKPLDSKRPVSMLYPHIVTDGQRRVAPMSSNPNSMAYLESHRETLEGRKYVTQAGRQWFEIWVPQDPDAWGHLKLVFRDIAAKPTFWIDTEGSVVNGDCYWLVCDDPAQTDLLWLAAAVGNSTFTERFYDCRFHNQLYAGRRRFMTQYVEQFPLPDPDSSLSKSIVNKAKQIYECVPSSEADALMEELNSMVWQSFGLRVEEVTR